MISYSFLDKRKSFPENSKVLVRVDFNVPLKNEAVADDSRISLCIPTIKLLLENNNAVILISHLGRPKKFEKNLSMRIVHRHLKKQTFFQNKTIHFCDSFEEEVLEREKKKIKRGEILLLENLRFDSGEQLSSLLFAEKIARNLDFFINDAFAVCHRKDASIIKIPSFFKKNKLPGLLLQKEIFELNKVLSSKHTKLAVIGGAKISTKVSLINKLLYICDDIIIGGAMAFSFIKHLNGSVGLSLYESEQMEKIANILQDAKKKKCTIHLPVDVITIKKDNNLTYERKITNIPDDEMGLDIGPKSWKIFESIILKSKTIIWNGPMGMFEKKAFKVGTEKILLAISSATQSGSYSLVGGGDTLSAISNFKKTNSTFHGFNFISSGGGAMLAFLQNPDLPGIKALKNE